MRLTVSSAVLAAAVLLATPTARAGECSFEAGPNDRVSQGERLVIRSGEQVDNAIAVNGDVFVEEGAVVEKAVAVGGSVTVRSGAQVRQDAVAIGGDVVVQADGRVGNDAVSLGGQVREAKGSRIRGSVVGLAIQGGKSTLAREILKGLSSLEGCQVTTKGATGG